MAHKQKLKNEPKPNELDIASYKKYGKQIHIAGGNEIKMSEVMEDWLGPLLDISENIVSTNSLVLMASMCWNLSYLDDNKISVQLNEIVKNTPPVLERRVLLRQICERLIQERRTRFSHIQRFIVDAKCFENPQTGELSLQVASVPIDESTINPAGGANPI